MDSELPIVNESLDALDPKFRQKAEEMAAAGTAFCVTNYDKELLGAFRDELSKRYDLYWVEDVPHRRLYLLKRVNVWPAMPPANGQGKKNRFIGS